MSVAVSKKIALPIDFELSDGRLSIRGAYSQPDQENLAVQAMSELVRSLPVLLHAKRGDRFPFAVAFTQAGAYLAGLDLVSLRAGIKEFEPERLVSLNSEDGDDFISVIIDGVQRHIIEADFGATKVNGILSNYEADEGTLLDMPFEIEAVIDGAAVLEGWEASRQVSLSGGHDSTEEFSFEDFGLDFVDGDFRLTISLSVAGAYATYNWPSQNIVLVRESTLTAGEPFVISNASGSLSGSGASPNAAQWQTTLAATVTGTNDGIDVDLDVDTTEVSFYRCNILLPDGYTVLPSGYFSGPGPLMPILYLYSGETYVDYVTLANSQTGYPDLSYSLPKLATDLQSKLSLGAAPLCVADSSSSVSIYFAADPGIDRMVNVRTEPDEEFSVSLVSGGHTIQAVLSLSLEQLGGESGPSGPVYTDYVRTSQTAILRLERDLIAD